MLAERRGAHAGQRLHAADQAPVERARRVEIVLRDARIEPHRQDVIDAVAGIGSPRGPDALEEQAREDHHHQRDGDLRDDERLPHPPPRRGHARLARLQHGVDVSARGANGRQQPRDEAGQQADRERKQRDARVDVRIELKRQIARDRDRSDERRASGGDAEASRGARRRQHGALDQELTEQLQSARADRQTHRRLAEPRGRGRQQQVRDVDARDRQDERRDAEEQP